MPRQFENLIAWQKAQDLAVLIYDAFRDGHDFDFNRQIKRAVVSISNNISEGSERTTDPDFKRFLATARGSAGEVRSMI